MKAAFATRAIRAGVMIARVAGALAALLPLSACGTRPPLVTVTVVDPAPPPPTVSAIPAVTPRVTAGVTLVTVTTVTATVTPRVTATVTPGVTPEASPTAEVVRVAGGAGQAVYLYNSPTTGDRIQAYPEGTPLDLIGGDVEGDGLTWHVVRAPDGTEGYIPVGDTTP